MRGFLVDYALWVYLVYLLYNIISVWYQVTLYAVNELLTSYLVSYHSSHRLRNI